jgi:site-specific recombinase XerD
MLKDLHHKQRIYCFKNRIPQSEYVFINKHGGIIAASNLDQSYKRLLQRAKIPYKKFHAIRHTFATEAIRRGVPVKDLQMLMGHSDIATTYIYVHATEGTKREAIELIGEMM